MTFRKKTTKKNDRQQKMFDEGLVSQTQLQQRNLSYQNALAKKIMVENKLAQTLQEVTNVKIEQNSVEQEYTEKISKAEGERFQSMSQIAAGQGDVAAPPWEITYCDGTAHPLQTANG